MIYFDPKIAVLTIVSLILLLVVPLITGIFVEMKLPVYYGSNLLKAVESAYKVGIIVLFIAVLSLFCVAVTCAIIYTAIFAMVHGRL